MKSRVLVLCALVLVIAISLAVLLRDDGQKKTKPAGTAAPSATPELTAETSAPRQAPKGTIADFFERLRRREITPAQLLAFREALLKGDPAKVIPAIRAFLATGQDVTTGLAFELGKGGSLERPPTFRLMLLDVLGQLSRTAKTNDAAEVSKQILATKQSPDEWAIAMRNVAWQDPQSRAYLSSKFAEMLSNQPWRSKPSAGFLEAFDIAVFSGQVAMMEPLNEALQSEEPDVQRAAAVALDRLAETAPLDVMRKLNGDPSLFADHPFLRADWFAKADLSDTAQRQAFETYLARPDVSLDEKGKALRALASPGQFLSDNLVTTPPPPADDTARDAAINALLPDWARRFPTLAVPLTILRERLSQ
jgi:hypothetical protein